MHVFTDLKRLGVTLGVAALVVSACGGSAATATSSAAPSAAPASVATSATPASQAAANPTGTASAPVSVAFSQADLSDPSQQALLNQLRADAKSAGVAWAGTASADDDPDKQLADISSLLALNPSALIVAPVDTLAIVPAIENANAQNVPVISVDQAPEGGKTAMVVGADNVLMGAMACQEMGKLLNGTGTVLALQGDLTSASGYERQQGFDNCMKSDFPNIAINTQLTKWDLNTAVSEAKTVLSSGKIDGIFWASDDFFPGVSKVLQEFKMWVPAGQPGHVAIVGIGGNPVDLQAIGQGYQDATVSQPLNLYAKYGIYYAQNAVRGMTWQLGPTDHNSQIVMSQGSMEDALRATLVTKDNYGDPSLWGNMK